jgi:hypothetical protein
MQLMDCTGNGHFSVWLPVTSVKEGVQLPVEGKLPAATFDVLADAGANGTGANGVTGSARRSVKLVPAGRVAVLIITPMRDTVPVAASFASVMLGEVIRPQ